MKCIYCFNKKTEVRNSREVKRGMMTWRRRYCRGCNRTFTTKESGYADNLFVIKRNGRRQRFMYEKLFVSLFTVLNTRKGGDHGDDAKLAKKLSLKIIEALFYSDKLQKEISSGAIIEIAHAQLKKLSQHYADQYIYYSSYRREVGRKIGLVGWRPASP